MKSLLLSCLLLFISSIESFQDGKRSVILRVPGAHKGLLEIRCDVSESPKTFVVHEANDYYIPEHQVEKIWWSFEGPFIRGMPCGAEPMCLACRNSTENCNVDAVRCEMLKNERWFVKVDPNNTQKGPSGQLYFSIYSDLFPTRCITYDRTYNRFKLEKCNSPPSELQSFFIDPDYFHLVQSSHVFVKYP